MGRHASADRRRGIAAWPLIALAVLLLAAGTTAVYLVAVNRKSTVADCTSSVLLPVVAAPGAFRAVVAAAAAFDATKPIARSTCVTTTVHQVDGATAAASLLHGWNDAGSKSTPAPALWVVDDPADVATVDAANPAITAGHSTTPVATSPVVLAVGASSKVSAADWRDLAGSLTGGRLTLPAAADNRATVAAAESVVAAQRTAGGTGAAPAPDRAQVEQSAGQLQSLRRSAATPAPATTEAALQALATGNAVFDAVPAMESQVATLGGTGTATLRVIYPAGPTAQDAILPVPITASWVTPTLGQAAATFDAFLTNAGGRRALADAGLRVPSTAPVTTSPAVDLAKTPTPLPATAPDVRQAIIDLLGAQSSGGSPTTPSSTSTPSTTPTSATSTSNTTSSSTLAGTSESSTLPTGPNTTSVSSTPSGSTSSSTAATTTGPIPTGSSLSSTP